MMSTVEPSGAGEARGGCERVSMRLFIAMLFSAAALSTPVQPAAAQPTNVRLGAMGDSLTDEYLEQPYGAYARSWTQLLVAHRGISMGPTAADAGVGYWGEPRRSGFEDNWARYASTTDGAIVEGQAHGVATGFEHRGTTHAVIFIGGNDFSPWAGPYNTIYHSEWTLQQEEAYFASRLLNFRAFLGQITQRGERVVLVNVLDFAFMPFVWGGHPGFWARDLVTEVIERFNLRLKRVAQEYGVVYLDLFRLTKDLFGSNEFQRQFIDIGGRRIRLLDSGIPPENAFVEDSAHPHTIIHAVWANAILAALNTGYGAGVSLFTERQMVEITGMVYNNLDTFVGVIAPYRAYVVNFACRADFNADQTVSVQDLFDFLGAYFGGDTLADLDRTGVVTVQDLFDFLAFYFEGCAAP